MKNFFVGLLLAFILFSGIAQEQPEPEQNQEQISENLIISKINFSGLKKTRNSYVQSKVKKFIGNPLTEDELHELETAIQLEGIFNEIKIETEQISGSEAQVNVSVKEKITFIPLPFAMYSNSGYLAGGIVLDTNAFGRKDMFMLGGFLTNTAKTGMASFSKQPKGHGIPGFSIFFSGSKRSPEFQNLDKNLILKYSDVLFNFAFTLTEKLSEHFSFANNFKFVSSTTEEHSDFLGANPESIKVGSTSLAFGYSNSDWNGIFMSTNSASISAEFGITDSDFSEFRYPLSFSFSIGEQHIIFTDRLRFYQKYSGFYAKDFNIALFREQDAGSVNILPGDFSTDRIIGGNLGLEVSLKKFSWGMLSLYGDYQLVYTRDSDKEYKFEHGPNAGTRVYLAKIAFPALAMGLAYNVPHHRWQFSAAMGVSF